MSSVLVVLRAPHCTASNWAMANNGSVTTDKGVKALYSHLTPHRVTSTTKELIQGLLEYDAGVVRLPCLVDKYKNIYKLCTFSKAHESYNITRCRQLPHFLSPVNMVKQSRYTPWRRLGERRYSSYSFSTPALDRGEWSASRPCRAFTPGTHCTGGWVGPRAGLDTEDRGKILCPRRGSNPDRPVVQPVVRHYTD
jgi:hypothetical protein